MSQCRVRGLTEICCEQLRLAINVYKKITKITGHACLWDGVERSWLRFGFGAGMLLLLSGLLWYREHKVVGFLFIVGWPEELFARVARLFRCQTRTRSGAEISDGVYCTHPAQLSHGGGSNDVVIDVVVVVVTAADVAAACKMYKPICVAIGVGSRHRCHAGSVVTTLSRLL